MHLVYAISKEYIRAPVSTVDENGLPVNVSLQNVQMAIIPTGTTPVTNDWITAEWETNTSSDPDTYYARLLVGPSGGSITLTAGLIYDVYTKISDNPEIIVLNAGPVGVM